ncbi:uncharacterized protein LOC143538518 [Bidens hawaiensis]|uniref:uncharacterized protein LOC143538518 n=1 Tax=Bidens hawaiensis TaxID=980011 RepID=UPI00404B34CF
MFYREKSQVAKSKMIKTTSNMMPNVSLKKLVLKFKKMKDGDEPELENARFENWMCEDEVMLHNSEHRLNVSPASVSSFKKMVSNGRTIKELIGEEERFNQTVRIEALEEKSRKGRVGSTEEVKKIVFENNSEDCLKSKSIVDYTRTRSRTRPSKLDSEEWRKLKNKRINEIMLKNDEQRKCVDVGKKSSRKKSKPGCKVNAYTPRTECRIKALEDMKRTRMKMNKEREIKDAFRAYADSFAILKSSYDPQQDFRDSMMEMIIENGIRQREDLEELLACYLTLNCDAYHHLIVKVFKEVWLELNQVYFDLYF